MPQKINTIAQRGCAEKMYSIRSMSVGIFFSATLRAVPETQQASRGRIRKENEGLFYFFSVVLLRLLKK